MDLPMEGRTERTVRIETLHGTVEGVLLVSKLKRRRWKRKKGWKRHRLPGPCRLWRSAMRTLDELNMASKAFLIVHSPVLDGTGWSFRDSELSVNKSTILFLAELSSQDGALTQTAVDFTRAPVRLRVGAFDIEGTVHVPPHGDPLLRFNQDTHPFIALTAGSVVGPDTQFEAPFLAIKRSHVLAAQPMEHQAPELRL